MEELELYIVSYYKALCDPLLFIEDVITDINNDSMLIQDDDKGKGKVDDHGTDNKADSNSCANGKVKVASKAQGGSGSEVGKKKTAKTNDSNAKGEGKTSSKAAAMYIDRDKFFKYIMSLPSEEEEAEDESGKKEEAEAGRGEGRNGASATGDSVSMEVTAAKMTDGAEGNSGDTISKSTAPPSLKRQVSWEDRAKRFDKYSIFYDESRSHEYDAPQQSEKIGMLPYLSRNTALELMRLLGVVNK